VVIGVIKGLFDGLIKQATTLAGLVAAIFLSGVLATALQPLLVTVKMIPEHLVYPICYAFSFLLIVVLLSLIGRLIRKIWELTPFGCLDHIAGGILGFVIPIISLSLIFNLLIIFDKQIPFIQEETRKESFLFEKTVSIVPSLYPYVRGKFEEELEKEELKKEESKQGFQPKEMII
jgi:membrane protein required for colicin V production